MFRREEVLRVPGDLRNFGPRQEEVQDLRDKTAATEQQAAATTTTTNGGSTCDRQFLSRKGGKDCLTGVNQTVVTTNREQHLQKKSLVFKDRKANEGHLASAQDYERGAFIACAFLVLAHAAPENDLEKKVRCSAPYTMAVSNKTPCRI